jgi:ATP-dependent helicase/nuclease subunit A
MGLRALKEYYDRRLWTHPATLIEEFVRERRLMELALAHPRPRERWRRYHFLAERARAFAQAGGASLRAFLDWAKLQEVEGARMMETPVPEGDEDAVRVMTIHAAKGLEFPIVLLTGLNGSRSPRNESILFDRESGRVEARLGDCRGLFSDSGLP